MKELNKWKKALLSFVLISAVALGLWAMGSGEAKAWAPDNAQAGAPVAIGADATLPAVPPQGRPGDRGAGIIVLADADEDDEDVDDDDDDDDDEDDVDDDDDDGAGQGTTCPPFCGGGTGL